MMLPPPARRISGTAYLHITKAPVRLTPMALFHSSSGSVSTVPSGVTAAATLTSVVSLPNAAMVRATASCALASSATSTASACARPPLVGDSARGRFRFGRIDIGDRDLGSLRRKASCDRAADLAAPAGDERDALAPACLPSPSVGGLLDEAAVENRRFGRERLLHVTDIERALPPSSRRPRPTRCRRGRTVSTWRQIIVGLVEILAVLLGVLHQDIDRLLLVGRIVEPADAPLVAAREGDQGAAVLRGPAECWRPRP